MISREVARQGMAARKGASTGSDSCLTIRSATSPALMASRELMVVTRDMVEYNMEAGRSLD